MSGVNIADFDLTSLSRADVGWYHSVKTSLGLTECSVPCLACSALGERYMGPVSSRASSGVPGTAVMRDIYTSACLTSWRPIGEWLISEQVGDARHGSVSLFAYSRTTNLSVLFTGSHYPRAVREIEMGVVKFSYVLQIGHRDGADEAMPVEGATLHSRNPLQSSPFQYPRVRKHAYHGPVCGTKGKQHSASQKICAPLCFCSLP